MNEELFEEELKNHLKKINIQINDEQVKKLFNYMNMLLGWNKKVNLTAITNQSEIILKHFVDSLTLLDDTKNAKEIIDIGTGAGFPGIPLSILNSNKFILIDSLQKRLNFLQEVKEKNNLKNVSLYHFRAEEIGQNMNFRNKFDCAVSRAVANLSVLSEYMLPLVKIGGKALCMKGYDIEDEIEEAKFAIETLGGKIVEIKKFNLAETEQKRSIIKIEKIKDTPKKYPRKAGLPSKQPLKKE